MHTFEQAARRAGFLCEIFTNFSLALGTNFLSFTIIKKIKIQRISKFAETAELKIVDFVPPAEDVKFFDELIAICGMC